MPSLDLLAVSGSLRRWSTNTALLRAAADCAPPGISVRVYDELGSLPVFNPDDEGDAPAVVHRLKTAVARADALLFAVPEYAHGIPGGLKNALDWLVSGPEIPGKPVALLHASPRSHHGRAALEEVLRTMSTAVVPDASVTVPLLGLSPDAVAGRLAEAEVRRTLEEALSRLAAHAARRRA